MQNEKIIWESPEYTYHEKSRDWFVVFGIIALAFFVVSILFKNFLFAAVIVIGAFSVVLHAKRKPATLSFEINRVGVISHRRFYPYSYLNAFFVDQTDPLAHKLLLTSHKMLMPMIVIPLGDQDPDEVRNFIANYLPEQELLEPLSHKMLDYFGF